MRERLSATVSTTTTNQDDSSLLALNAEMDISHQTTATSTTSQGTVFTALGGSNTNTIEGGTSTSHSYDSMPTTGIFKIKLKKFFK